MSISKNHHLKTLFKQKPENQSKSESYVLSRGDILSKKICINEYLFNHTRLHTKATKKNQICFNSNFELWSMTQMPDFFSV